MDGKRYIVLSNGPPECDRPMRADEEEEKFPVRTRVNDVT